MILTHGGNSIPRGLKLLYALDVDSFNLQTLNDSGVQWTMFSGNAIQLSKSNGALNIQFVGGTKTFLILPKSAINYNDAKDHIIKMTLSDIEWASSTLTVGCFPQCFSYGFLNVRGQWGIPTSYTIDMLNSSLSIRRFGNTNSVVDRPATAPWNTKWEILHEDGVTNIYVYWNDVLACRIRNADITDLFMTTTDYNGSSYRQLITLSSYEIWEC